MFCDYRIGLWDGFGCRWLDYLDFLFGLIVGGIIGTDFTDFLFWVWGLFTKFNKLVFLDSSMRNVVVGLVVKVVGLGVGEVENLIEVNQKI